MEGKRFVALIMPHMFNRTAGERDVGVCGPGDRRQVPSCLASETVRNGLKVNGEFAGAGKANASRRNAGEDNPGFSRDIPELELWVNLGKLLFCLFISVDPHFDGIGASD